jgi:hypothetical protein
VVVSGATRGTCQTKKTCADYTNRQIGSPCNDNNYFSDGFTYPGQPNAGKFTCTCLTSGGFNNAQCVGDSTSAAGTCQCTPRSCNCGISGQSNYCGGTLSCPCKSGEQCNTSSGTCCTVYSCSNLPPGYPAGGGPGTVGAACGNISNTCLGTTFPCACSTGGTPPWTNNKCVSGTCQCTPATCAELGAGVHNNGCGGTINCQS